MPIHAHGVSFEFSNGNALFNDLNFRLSNKITALVGPNGIGKSTLARILAGQLESTTGRISGKANYFAQKEQPPTHNVTTHLGEAGWDPRTQTLIQDINPDQNCNTLSGGQWMRVRLAKALTNGFLILDEPTNDLDRQAREALLTFIKTHKDGILLISHDRECLNECDEVLELSNQGLVKYGIGWKEYERRKHQEREKLKLNLEQTKRDRSEAHRKRQEELSKQEKRNRKGREFSESGSLPRILAGGLKRAAQKTTGKIDASTMERANDAVANAFGAYKAQKIDPIMYANLMGKKLPEQKLIAEARSFNVRYNNWLYPRDLEFTWRGNIRIAIKGGNGSGKSTLIKAILSQGPQRIRGNFRRGDLRHLYIDQRTAILDDNKSILENIRDNSNLDESEARTALAKFLFTKDTVFQKVSTLSGGERLRAALAKGLLNTERPELLIVDEPTNNLDLANIQFLENLIKEFQGAVIAVSHDDIFLKNCGITEEFEI